MGRRRYGRGNGERNLAIFLVVIFIAWIVISILYKIFLWIKNHIVGILLVVGILAAVITLLVVKVPLIRNVLARKVKIFGIVSDEEIKNIIEVIKSIKLQDVKDEEDFEKQIYQRLEAKEYDVERQVKFGDKRKIDLIVNNVGIELKIADRAKNIQDLIGQMTMYKSHFRKIIAVILDVGMISDIHNYIEHIRSVDLNKINVVLVKGDKDFKRRMKNKEYVIMEKDEIKAE